MSAVVQLFAALVAAAWFVSAASCELGAPVSLEPVEPSLDCPRVALFDTDAELEAALPGLFGEHRRDLIVIGRSVYLSGCSETRLAGEVESSRLGGEREDGRFGAESESSRLAGKDEAGRLAGDAERSRLGGDDERGRVGGDAESGRLAGNAERSRLGGDDEAARLGSDGEEGRLRGDEENGRLAGGREGGRLAGAMTRIACRRCPNELGYEVLGQVVAPVRIFDGVALLRLVDGSLLAAPLR